MRVLCGRRHGGAAACSRRRGAPRQRSLAHRPGARRARPAGAIGVAGPQGRRVRVLRAPSVTATANVPVLSARVRALPCMMMYTSMRSRSCRCSLSRCLCAPCSVPSMLSASYCWFRHGHWMPVCRLFGGVSGFGALQSVFSLGVRFAVCLHSAQSYAILQAALVMQINASKSDHQV